MLSQLNYSVSYVYPFPRCGGTAVCWSRGPCSEEEAKLFSSTKQHPHRYSLCSTHHIAILSVAFCNLFGFSSAPQNTLRADNYQPLFSFNHTKHQLPWIACVRLKAWAGHRPSLANCSHLDSHQLISCDFTLELFFTWTRDGCTGNQQAWQEVNKSKARGPEKGMNAFFHILLDPDPNLWPLLLFIFSLVCSPC